MASNHNPVDEQTPLITVVRVQRPRQRYQHNRVRRFCTFCLSSILLTAVILYLLLVFVVPDCEDLRRHNHRHSKLCLSKHPFFRNHWHTNHFSINTKDGLSYDELLDVLADTPEEDQVREWSKYYTSGPHLAGRNLSQAEWTRDKWAEFGVEETRIESYDVYTNYPVDHRLALLERQDGEKSMHETKSKRKHTWKVKFEANLTEDVLDEDSTSGLQNRIPTFHGYSASGNVTASYVFCNYGTFWDYEELVQKNISLSGKIALVKYGRNFRGLKVKRAQELGMVGVVMYSDPGDDGEFTDENGYDTYPKGPARNPSSVQRGSVQFLSIYPGDPTTPGYASKPGVPRQSPNVTTPGIPSLPISYKDALPILKALNGHGPKAKSLSKYWQGGGLGYKGIDYNIGPTPGHVQLNLYNKQDYVTTPIWNVIGVINGTLSDEVVILGNHRDAWIAGGAGDPNSGSAAMNEVVRSFGVALSHGWKPLRTILFASWDGEEYGLLGSTEWVEEYVAWLGKTAVAYINVDVGTDGPNFDVSAAPLLYEALREATKLVWSPNETESQTVYDVWDKKIKTLGSGSDYTAFQDFVGIPSVDMGFRHDDDSAVYHYHSNYDSFAWMDRFGDRNWTYHTTMARLWSILAASIVERPILPFNATVYAHELRKYLDSTRLQAASARTDDDSEGALNSKDTFKSLETSIDKLYDASVTFDARAAQAQHKVTHELPPWWHWWDRAKLRIEVKKVNQAYKLLERQFVYEKGFDKRPWFKHVVFAPGIWTGYAGATFPPLSQAIEEKDRKGVEKWVSIIVGRVEDAVQLLKG